MLLAWISFTHPAGALCLSQCLQCLFWERNYKYMVLGFVCITVLVVRIFTKKQIVWVCTEVVHPLPAPSCHQGAVSSESALPPLPSPPLSSRRWATSYFAIKSCLTPRVSHLSCHGNLAAHRVVVAPLLSSGSDSVSCHHVPKGGQEPCACHRSTGGLSPPSVGEGLLSGSRGQDFCAKVTFPETSI